MRRVGGDGQLVDQHQLGGAQGRHRGDEVQHLVDVLQQSRVDVAEGPGHVDHRDRALAEELGDGYAEEGESKVVSVFSLGESSFREGTHAAKESSASTTIDGSKVSIKSSDPPPSAQIQIGGFAQIKKINNAEIAVVSPTGPSGTAAATGGFPIQVLLILGGMMGAVAILVLIKARKP